KSLRAGAIRLDRVDLVIALSEAREHNQIATRRPQRKSIVAFRDCRRRSGFQIENLEAVAVRTKRSVDDSPAIRRHGWKRVVARSVCEFPKLRTVGIDHRDLRA